MGDLRTYGALLLALLLFAVSPAHAATPNAQTEETLFGDRVTRDGLHLQVAFGWHAGPEADGLFHALELGYTLPEGWTVTYLYTLLQNRGFGVSRSGPERLEGHLLGLKVPLYYPELVAKVAVGAEVVDDPAGPDVLGIGWLYGVDLHLPMSERSGFTVGVAVHHATVKGGAYWGVSLGGGYTCF